MIRMGETRKEDSSLKALEAQSDRLLDFIWYVDEYPKEKDEGELRDTIDLTQTGKILLLSFL
jgi:hypothetical protein